jgi:hypothetical protein
MEKKAFDSLKTFSVNSSETDLANGSIVDEEAWYGDAAVGANRERHGEKRTKVQELGATVCRNRRGAYSVLLGQHSCHLSQAMFDFDDKGVPSWAEPQLHHTSIRC